MGKSIPSTINLHDFARVITSDKLRRPVRIKPVPKPLIETPTGPAISLRRGVRVESEQLNLNLSLSLKMESGSSGKKSQRTPLSEVVSDCENRWFEETLKEAEAGDSGMQLLVGQMYCNGYGVKRDYIKGRHWISKASQTHSSAWNCGYKQPGYNASDSESDDE